MMYKFVLVSRRNSDCTKIREELERNRLYQAELIETAPMALKRLKQPDVDCLVLNLESFNVDKIHMLTDLRDLGLGFPIMVFANYIQKDALAVVAKIPSAVLIEKPFESKDLWGIAQKLVQGVQVNQRIHRRFYTSQTARFEKLNSGLTFTGHVYNMSKGGAYVETDQHALRVGDVVRMSVQLNKVSRMYNVDAEVIWAAPKGNWKGKPAVGVRFVTAGDVYRNLLNRL